MIFSFKILFFTSCHCNPIAYSSETDYGGPATLAGREILGGQGQFTVPGAERKKEGRRPPSPAVRLAPESPTQDPGSPAPGGTRRKIPVPTVLGREFTMVKVWRVAFREIGLNCGDSQRATAAVGMFFEVVYVQVVYGHP
eukprot:COSAG02_NODE_1700_length_11253_cov_40.995786_5_plen_140_part_00